MLTLHRIVLLALCNGKFWTGLLAQYLPEGVKQEWQQHDPTIVLSRILVDSDGNSNVAGFPKHVGGIYDLLTAPPGARYTGRGLLFFEKIGR